MFQFFPTPPTKYMDAFVQHFNNIFMSSPYYETHDQCIDALEHLCNTLSVSYLTQFQFENYVEQQPSFDKNPFPGVQELSTELLIDYFDLLSNQNFPINKSQKFYFQQTQYILQLLRYFRQRISANSLDCVQYDSLLQKAWSYRLKQKHLLIQQENIEQKITLDQLVQQICYIHFNSSQKITFEQLLIQLELSLVQLSGALAVLTDQNANFLQQLNKLLLKRGFKAVKLEIAEDNILGCEQQLSFQQLQQVAKLAQENFASKSTFYHMNGLLVLYSFSVQMYNQFQKPVKQILNQLIKEEIEFQIINIQQFHQKDKRKMFSFLLYMLSGVVFYFKEVDFYTNLCVLLNEFYTLLNVILVKDTAIIKQANKQYGLLKGCFQNCSADNEMFELEQNDIADGKRVGGEAAKQPEQANSQNPHEKYVTRLINVDNIVTINMQQIGNKQPDTKQFYSLLNMFSQYLHPYVYDNIKIDVNYDFIIVDKDLDNFLSQLNGLDQVYTIILRIYLYLKSIFKQDQFTYLFQGLQLFIRSIQGLNTHISPLVSILKDDIFHFPVKPGRDGVEQLLNLIGKQMNKVLIGGIIVDEDVSDQEIGSIADLNLSLRQEIIKQSTQIAQPQPQIQPQQDQQQEEEIVEGLNNYYD